jgi:transcriptional regulator with XRE-family HTH domain
MAGPVILAAEALRKKVTPVERVKMAPELMKEHQAEIARLAGVRRDALRELRQQYTVAEIAELVGLSVPQVYSLMDGKAESLSNAG